MERGSSGRAQSEFTIQFTATGPGNADQLHAFVVTRLLNASIFALEIGRASTTGLPVVTSSQIYADITGSVPGRPPVRVTDHKILFEPTQTAAAAVDETGSAGGTKYRSFGSASTARSVSIGSGTTSISGSARLETNLTAQPPRFDAAAGTSAEANQEVCFDLGRPNLATYSV